MYTSNTTLVIKC